MEKRIKRIMAAGLPEDQKISRLLREIERTRRSYMDRELKRLGLQGDMYLYLLTVSRYPGVSQDTLSQELLTDKGNIARNAKKLEDLGFLRRASLPADRRQYELFLTETGEEAVKEVRKVLIRWHETATSGMDETGKQRLVESLLEILKRSEYLNNGAGAGEGEE